MHTGTPAVITADTHVLVVQIHMVHAVRLQLIIVPRERQVAHAVSAPHQQL